MTKTNRIRLRLATNDGVRIDESSDSSPTLHGEIGKSELTVTQGLDLPSASFGDLAIPHAHGFTGDAESVGKRLMGPAEVVKDFLKRDAGLSHDASVSMLPHGVKPLTRGSRAGIRKLTYMSRRKSPDSWAIERGAAMRSARMALKKSQAQIAELAGVKDRETISQYESGVIADIDQAVIPRLAMALGLPAQRLSRTPWGARDEASDLRISSVARQIAYSFDQYPLAIQNQIRETITRYETLVKQHGKAAADALFGPAQQKPESPPLKRQAHR